MGVTVITTITAPATATPPAGPYDLTTLANVHDELSLATNDTANDPFLLRAIVQSSAAINTYCGRVFAIEGLTDLLYIQQDPYPFQTPGGVAPLQLSRWPLANVFTVATAAAVASGAVLPFGSTPQLVADDPVSGLNIPPGATVQSFGGGNVTLTLPVGGPIPAGTPITFGLSVAQTIPAGAKGMILGQDYALDAKRGQLTRLNRFTGIATIWEALPVTVAYVAGYAAVPSDIEDACLRLVTMRYYARGRDPALRETDEPGLGRMTYWIGGPPKSGRLPEEVTGLIEDYRVPVAV